MAQFFLTHKDNACKERFGQFKKKYLDQQKNKLKQTAKEQIATIETFIVNDINCTHLEYIEASENLTYDQYIEFCMNYATHARIKSYIGGNMEEKKAKELIESFVTDFQEMIKKASGSPLKCLEKTDVLRARSAIFSEKTQTILESKNTNLNDKNMAMKILFDCGPIEDYRPESLFIRAFLKEKYFTEMRTKRQLGYSVLSSCSNNNFIHRITFNIQVRIIN